MVPEQHACAGWAGAESAVTLLDILPSLRGTTTSRLDPTVWPVTTHYRHGRITVGGVDLDEVADRFGTPTYVLDEVGLRGAGATISRGFRHTEVLCGTSSLLTGGVALAVAGLRCDAAPNPDDISDRMLTAVAVMCDTYREHQVLMTELHVGIATGGTDSDGASGLGDALENAVDEACIRNRLPCPRIAVDFGDSITGRAAVTVTRVRGVDRTDSGRPVVVEGSAGSAIAVTAGEPVAAAIANRHPLGPTEIFPIVDSRGVMGDHFCSGVVLSQDIRAGDVVALVGRDGRDLLDSAQVVSVAHGRIHQIPAE